jgi:cytochrome c553
VNRRPLPIKRRHTPGCQAPAGVSDRPRSIDQTVELVNALPKPLVLPCFVEALARPLLLHATLSVLSQQPARGLGSPRMFIYLDPLILSVAPAGAGAHLLELGEQRPGYRSLKAELAFPIAREVAAAEPYEHALFNEALTGCAFCHADEQRDPAVVGASGYVSQSLRPLPGERLPLLGVRDELAHCDAELEPERCAMLDALFGWGEAVDWEFPPEMATFGG